MSTSTSFPAATPGSFSFPAYRPRIIRQQSRILATAAYLPDRVVSNQDIVDAGQLPVTDVVVRKTLGIASRRVAPEGVADSDLLTEAARRCLAAAGLAPDQLSRILVTKLLGDRVLPMTASLVQRQLNCTVAMHAVDVEGGTSAFLHAVDLAIRYISTAANDNDNDNEYILVLSGGLHNLPVSKTDPRVAFLFGDGAAAVLLGVAAEPHFLASYAYTNHAYFAAAGTRTLKVDQSVSERIYERREIAMLYDFYTMGNWKDTADFYVEAAQVTRDRLLQESRLAMDDIDLVLVTENNRRLRDLTLAALGVPEERSLTVIQDYGNTMSAMLPLLLHKAYQEHRLQQGMHVMLISHGEGASGGGLIYRV
jgi:3-oxoacyl-[acyl-carrier-protein] synthase-3